MESKRLRLKVLEGKKNNFFVRAQTLFDLIPKLQSDQTSKNNFLVRYQTLEETRSLFYRCVEDMNVLEIEIDSEAQPNFQSLTVFDELYGAIVIAYDKLQVEANTGLTESKPNLRTENTNEVHTQLPRIEINKFSGKIQDWPEFRDLFNAVIISNKTLSNAQKYHYLRTFLEPEALKLINSFPLSAEHFHSAWLALEERFENKRLLAARFFEELFSYEKPPSQPTVKNLQHFLSHFHDAYIGLSNLNIENTTDLIMLNLALRRLDPQTIKAFEKEHVSIEFPSYDSLVVFIKNQLKILELSNLEGLSHFSSKNTTQDVNKGKVPKRVFLTNSPQASAQSSQTEECNSASLQTYTAPTDKYNCTSCPLCQTPHPLYKCSLFHKLTPEQRLQQIQRYKACKNCLSLTHSIERCRSNSHCFKCRSRHHTMIHLDSLPRAQYTSDKNPSRTKGASSAKQIPSLPQTSALTHPKQSIPLRDEVVLLGTALVHLQTPNGEFVPVRALIDTASTRSCITKKCVTQLGLSVTQKHQPFVGLGGVPVVAGIGTTFCTIKPRNRSAPLMTTEAIVIPEIVGQTPPSSLPSHIVSAYAQLPLADPYFGESGPADILLGADLFLKILSSKPHNRFYEGVLNTVFGAVIMGPLTAQEGQKSYTSFCTLPDNDVSSALTRFWEIEEVPTTQLTDPEDDLCEQHFLSTHRRNSDGRYSVSLPFRKKVTFLESREVAIKRFLSLERRFLRNPELKEKCFSFLQEYIDLGHMDLSNQEAEYYLPYFCVHNSHSLTTPVRVVFDGSAKQSHLSLNQVLYAGPKLQKEVPDILLNFRLHQFVFSCDIIKMFRQILLNEEDRKFTHILFRQNPDLPLKQYRLNTVTYGLACSPWHAQRVLIQLVRDDGKNFPLASRVLINDTFMDDIITGTNSKEELIAIAQQLVQLLRAGGFELSKWISNSPEFLLHIKSSYSNPLVVNNTQTQSCKILGIRWEPTEDVFSYEISLPKQIENTKRTALSIIAGIFDPLGFIAPLIFSLKCFMQKLWKHGIEWDQRLSKELLKEWRQLTENFHLLSNIRIPRCILPQNVQSIYVLGFSDASEKGYGCVIYLRASTGHTQPKVSLLMARSKVAPVKGATIPRLELLGALLLARTISALKSFLSKIKIEGTYFFTDSTIVLSWLQKPPHTLKQFVANRVSAILDHTSLSHWRHIKSKQNPADIVSRGLNPAEMVNSQEWFHGPSWMLLSLEEWPESDWKLVTDENLLELKQPPLILLTKERDLSDIEWISKFSSFNKIQRIQAYILRFISNTRLNDKSFRRTGISLSIEELRDALLSCVYQVQRAFWSGELDLLKQGKLKSSRLLQLSPFIDSKGLLRVGGRLKHADVPYSVKHPLLLPKHSHLTHSLIDYYHKSYLHAGPRTLRALLQRSFWILSAHSIIRQRIRLCQVCSRYSSSPPSPLMADLPSSRVTPTRPFMHCGVDLAGPFQIKESTHRKARVYKAYFALFICMATKAVHIEALTSLSTEAFLSTLGRLVARRGLPTDIYCDNGTNFRGADRQLSEIVAFVRSKENQEVVQSALNMRGIKFHFSCPKAPFMGGLYESNIKNVKFHLNRVVGNHTLTLEEFSTVLARVEAVLNSRPLCEISPSPDELEALTPGHFLTGGPLLDVPEPQLLDVSLNRLNRWQMVSHMIQHFWKRWSNEYLLSLQQRSKWFTPDSENLKVGQLVWIKEDGVSPLNYHLGKIEEVLPNSNDGIVRIVNVRTASGLLQRPVRKLAPLYLS